jgi:hypothetical protein
LTYKGTSPNPVETNYQKKTGWYIFKSLILI